MSKPSYDDLADMIVKIYRETRLEGVLGIDSASYPIEVFDELAAIKAELESENE